MTKTHSLAPWLFCGFVGIALNIYAAERPERNTVAPPQTGIYLGQTSFRENEVEQFERAIGKEMAIVVDPWLVRGQEEVGESELSFDIEKARRYWSKGYVIAVAAYEAYPGHKPFTVDNLIQGKYDKSLSKLAEQFRAFGKPMFFMTAREPNGVLAPYMGGFGAKGNKSVEWAIKNKKGFAEFTPPPGPEGNHDLFSGLANPTVNDGIERLAAAQRYYYDFFVRRKGLNFLTFESMGWAIHPDMYILDEGIKPGSHEAKLLHEGARFEVLYELIKDYVDWISINWYVATHPEKELGEPRARIRPIHDFTRSLERFLSNLAEIAPSKPILVTELGFPSPKKDRKVTAGMNLLLKHHVGGFIMWGDKYLIRPDTPAARAFRKLITDDQDAFQSVVHFSDGSKTRRGRNE